MKKAELIMSVEKLADNSSYSKVSCEMIRGVSDFNDFYFYVDEKGFPVIEDRMGILNINHLTDENISNILRWRNRTDKPKWCILNRMCGILWRKNN